MTTTARETGLDRFVEGFRQEHREALHAFLGIAEAFRQRDGARIGELMGQANAGIGPHMQYEEETMYPSLVQFFGPAYVEKMLSDHDRAFGVAGRLMELAAHEPITEEDVAEADDLVKGLIPHVSDCDGLVVFLELLPPEQQRALCESRDRAVNEALTMMEWGERRGRAPAAPR
jgi:hemerythrin HHE cation binding domain-containing protein